MKKLLITITHKYTHQKCIVTNELSDKPEINGKTFEFVLEQCMDKLGCTDKNFLDISTRILNR